MIIIVLFFLDPRIQRILYKYQKTLGPKAITTNNRRLTCQTLVPIMSKMSNKGANEASALQPTLSIIVKDCQQLSTILNLVSIFNLVKTYIFNIYKYQKILTCKTLVLIMSRMSNKGANGTSPHPTDILRQALHLWAIGIQCNPKLGNMTAVCQFPCHSVDLWHYSEYIFGNIMRSKVV